MARQRLTAEDDKEARRKEWEARRKECCLASIVGQEDVIKRLRAFASLFRRKPEVAQRIDAGGTEANLGPQTDLQGTPGHVLFVGPDGMGKQTIARAFAADYCNQLVETTVPTFATTGDLVGVLTDLGEGDALLIADIDRAPKVIAEEFLFQALTDRCFDLIVNKGMFARTVKYHLKPFVLLATARSPGACSRKLLECFHLTVPLLQRYSEIELAVICQRVAKQRSVLIVPDAVTLVAGASRGSPHELELIVGKLVSLGKATIAPEDVTQLLSILGLGARAASGGTPFGGLDALSGVEFERAITGLLERMGFRAEMTKASGDGGIDIMATLDRPIVGGRSFSSASASLRTTWWVRPLCGSSTAR